MKKINQKGFTTVEIIIAIVVVGLIVGAGWLVFNRRSDKKAENTEPTTSQSAESTSSTTASSETATASTAQPKIDTTIHTVSITLRTEADIAKLPSYTPASFKTYMTGLLRNNKPKTEDGITYTTEYSISKISQVNIKGGKSSIDENGQDIPSGAPYIWVVTPKGTWDEEGLNGPDCKSENGGLLYEEFVEMCANGPQGTNFVKNPNGSITSINK